MTDEEKLEVIIEELIRVTDGGYRGAYRWFGDTLAYTWAIGGAMGWSSDILTISKQEMLAWFDRAWDYVQKDDPSWDNNPWENNKKFDLNEHFRDALCETEPPPLEDVET